MRGGQPLHSMASANANTCDANGAQSQTGNQLISTVQPGLALTFSSNTASAPSLLVDPAALIEESYGADGSIAQAAFAGGGQLTYVYSAAPISGVAPTA